MDEKGLQQKVEEEKELRRRLKKCMNDLKVARKKVPKMLRTYHSPSP